jgi:pyruvyltransferase
MRGCLKMIIKSCLSPNWGDNLNSELCQLISGEKPQMVNNRFANSDNETIYLAIGSVLQWADKNTEIWSTGAISDTDSTMFKEEPKAIHSVRGPLTRDKILRYGYKCPEIYGDGALLMPLFYSPKLPKKYKLSVIPHYIDKPLIPELEKEYPTAHFIDIQQGTYSFINEVIQSEYVISSTLHGCICAYSYNVPYEHKAFSNKVLGNGFKFRDFEESKPFIDLDKLMEVCPFKKDH